MVSRTVKEEIYKLKLDANDLQAKLQNVLSNVSKFQSKMDSIKPTSINGLEKSTSSFSSKMAGLVNHIPILGNIVNKMSGVKEQADNASGSISKIGNSAAQGLGGVISNADKATSSVGQIDTAVQRTQNSFSVLEGAAAVALGNIATKAISTATSILNKWTLKPVIDGYQEYERELESTRVLVGALGEEEQDHITAVMRDLEQYAKTTKYNSQQMNSSLARFVNAGIDIDRAGTALKGWGNLAASAAASTDNFNTSLTFGVQQALAMGYMNRQNWMSVSNAFMDTAKFKEMLVDIALQMGTLDEALLKKYGGVQGAFIDGLAEAKWLTNDVLMTALEQYASDPAFLKMAENIYTFKEALEATEEAASDAWSKMWVELVGKGDEAMAIWTPVGAAMADAVSFIPNIVTEIAKSFNMLGGRVNVIDSILSVFYNFKMVGTGIKNAFSAMIPSVNLFTEWSTEGNMVALVFENIAKGIIKIADFFTEMTLLTEDSLPGLTLAVHNIVEVFIRMFNLLKDIGKIAFTVFEFFFPDNLIQNGILILGILSNIINGIFRIGDGIKSKIDTSKFAHNFLRLHVAIDKIMNTLTRLIYTFWQRIDEPMDTFFDKLGLGIGDYILKLKHLFGFNKDVEEHVGLFERFVGWVESLVDKFNKFVDNYTSLEQGEETVKNMESAFEKIYGWIMKALDGLLLLQTPIAYAWNGLKLIYDLLKQGFDMPISDKIGSLKDGLISIKDFIKKDLADFSLFGTKAYADELGGDEADKIVEKQKIHKSLLDVISRSVRDMGKAYNDVNKDTVPVMTQYNKNLSKSKNLVDIVGASLDALWLTIRRLTKGLYEVIGAPFIKMIVTASQNTSTALGGIVDAISKMGIFEGIGLSIGRATLAFEGFGKAIKDAFKNLDFSNKFTLFQSLIEGVGRLLAWLAERFGDISRPIGTVFQYFSDLIDTFARGLEKNATLKVGGLFLFWKWMQGLKDGDGLISKILHPIRTLMEFFSGGGRGKGLYNFPILNELSGALKAFQKDIRANSIKKIAQSLLILSGALWVISTIPTDKLLPAVGAITALATGLTGAFMAIQFAQSKWQTVTKSTVTDGAKGIIQEVIDDLGIPEITKVLKKIASATMIMSLAMSVLAIASVIKKLADYDWNTILKGITAVGLVMLELTAANWLNGLVPGSGIGNAVAILALASGVKKLISTINMISDINEDSISKGMDVLGKVAVLMGSMMALMGFKVGAGLQISDKFNLGLNIESGDGSFGTAATLYVLMTRFKNLIGSLDMLKGLSGNDITAKTKSIEFGMKQLETILTMLRDFMMLMGATFDLGANGTIPSLNIGGKKIGGGNGMIGLKMTAGNAKWSTAATLISLIKGISILTNIINKLSTIDDKTIALGTERMRTIADIIMGMYLAISLLSSSIQFGSKKFGMSSSPNFAVVGILASIILGIIILGSQIKKLAAIDTGEIFKGELAIAGLALIVGGLYAAIIKFSNLSSAGGMRTRAYVSKNQLGMLITAVAGLVLLSGTVLKLSEVDAGGLMASVGIVGLLGTIIALLYGAIMYATVKTQNMSTKNLAVSIGALLISLGSLMILSYQVTKMSELDMGALMAATGIVATLGLLIAGMTASMMLIASKLADGASIVGVGKTLVSLGASILSIYALGEIVKGLAKVDAGQLQNGTNTLTMIAVIATAMTGALILLSKLSTGNITGIAATLITLGAVVLAIYALGEQVIKLGAIPEGQLVQGGLAVTALGVVLGLLTALFVGLGYLASGSLLGIVVVLVTMGALVLSLKSMGDTVVTLSQLSVGDLTKGGIAITALGVILALLVTLFGGLAVIAGMLITSLWGFIPVVGIMVAMGPALQSMAEVVLTLEGHDVGSLMGGALVMLALGVVLAVLTALFTVISAVATFAGAGVDTAFNIANKVIESLKTMADAAISLQPYVGLDLFGAVVVMGGLAVILGATTAILSLISNFTSAEGALGQVTIMTGFTRNLGSLAQTAMTLSTVANEEGLITGAKVIAKLGSMLGWQTLKSSFGSWLTGGDSSDKATGQVTIMTGFTKNVVNLARAAMDVARSGDLEGLDKSVKVIKKLGKMISNATLWEDIKGKFSSGDDAVTRVKNSAKMINEYKTLADAAIGLSGKNVNIDDVDTNLKKVKNIAKEASSLAGIPAINDGAIQNMTRIKSMLRSAIELVIIAREAGSTDTANTSLTGFANTIKTIVSQLSDVSLNESFFKAGQAHMGNYAQGLSSVSGNAVSAAQSVVQQVRASFNGSNMTPQGNIASRTYGSGIGAMTGSVSNIARGVVTVAGGVFALSNNTGHGNKAGSTYGSGISGARGGVTSAANSIRDAASSGMMADGTVTAKLRSAGSSLANAVAGGIRSAIGTVTSAVSDLWSHVKKYIPNSPAKLGPMSGAGWRKVEHSGRTIVETIAGGMGAAAPVVIETITGLMGEIQNEIDALNSYDYDGLEIEPTIKPVLDMTGLDQSALQYATNYAGMITPTNSVTVSYGNLNPQVAQMLSQQSNFDLLQKQVGTLNRQMDNLTSINQQQAQLLQEGQNQQVYLDGRRINNVLAPGMTNAQEFYQARQKRIKGDI